MRLSEEAKGVFIISATPFLEDGALDLESATRLVDFYLECGVHGITILGMMGEAPKLAPEEARTFTKTILGRVAGRVPVIVGVSGAGLDNMARFSSETMDLGAAGVMVAPAPGLLTGEKIRGYFAAVCEALGPDIPIVYQDYPQSTGVHLSVPTFNALVDAHPQIVMLKHEDCPGLSKITEIREGEKRDGRRRVSILVGNGGLYYPQELARGADGAMTGFAFPEMLVRVYERFTGGDREAAEDLFDAYLPLVRYEQQPGIGLAVRKEILRRRGVIASARTRRPGPSLTPADHEELNALMARLEQRLRREQLQPVKTA
jgi:4-hydroxy-tetrahydrodipicolinate synthase